MEKVRFGVIGIGNMGSGHFGSITSGKPRYHGPEV